MFCVKVVNRSIWKIHKIVSCTRQLLLLIRLLVFRLRSLFELLIYTFDWCIMMFGLSWSLLMSLGSLLWSLKNNIRSKISDLQLYINYIMRFAMLENYTKIQKKQIPNKIYVIDKQQYLSWGGTTGRIYKHHRRNRKWRQLLCLFIYLFIW